MIGPDDVLGFWLDECGPKVWYNGDDALDATIRDRFEVTWDRAMAGGLGFWLTYPSGVLAYLILTDQFSRNMFRGTPKSFSSDRSARAAAKMAIDRDWDLKIAPPGREFFYMPLSHSENLIDQDRAVRLICSRLPDRGGGLLIYAKGRREVIRRFGRFPYRNKVLGRRFTPEEEAFEAEGGFGALLKELRAKDAA